MDPATNEVAGEKEREAEASDGSTPFMGRPPISIVPASGSSRPAITRSAETDFPLPA